MKEIAGATESLSGEAGGNVEKESTPASDKVGSKRKSVAAGGGMFSERWVSASPHVSFLTGPSKRKK